MIESFVYYAIALLVAITVHEAAHAWMAYKLGDYTAKYEGRVTLNPVAHLDPIGTIMIFIVHFGWGKPVPFNPHNLKKPKRDSALIAIAGPMANFITALILMIPYKYIPFEAIPTAGLFLRNVVEITIVLNIYLLIFNLIPIAPLDGSKFIGAFVPYRYEYYYQKFLHFGPMLLISILFLQFITNIPVLSIVLMPLFDVIWSFIVLIT